MKKRVIETARIRFVFGCLVCEKPIPIQIANKGIMFCSKKCLRKLKTEMKLMKIPCSYTNEEVWVKKARVKK